MVDKIVKPFRFRPGRKQKYSHPALSGVYLSERLFHPSSDRSPVWRIAEHNLTGPVLRESVLLLCVILITLMVQIICTRVKSEMEFSVQLVIQFLRRLPARVLTAKQCFLIHNSPQNLNCTSPSSIAQRNGCMGFTMPSSSRAKRRSKSWTVWPSGLKVTGLSRSHFMSKAQYSG